MGESFIGLPNRFKVINNLLESTYNPNHVLSAYQGYRLSVDYVKRSGGEEYAMTGSMYTESMYPNKGAYYGNYGTLQGSDLGRNDARYRYIYGMYIYGESFVGNASSASKLNHTIDLNVTGAVSGSASFDCSGNISLNLSSTHNHDDKYLPLTGGSLTGNLVFNGTNIGILDKDKRQILTTSSSTTYIGRGPYTSNVGNLEMYSSGYMSMHTKQNDIRISIESATHAPFKPYISIGADATGAYIKYSKNASRLYLENGTMTYNGYTVYHSGNLTLSDYASSTHNHDDKYLPLTGGSLTGNLVFNGTNIGILDKDNCQILSTDSSSITHLGKGTFSKNTGSLSLYSNSYMEIRTKVDDIRISIESATHAPFKPYISIGADATGAYIKYSKNAGRLCLESTGLTYNGYTVYHSGNLTLSDYALATHTHDSRYLPLTGGSLTGNLVFNGVNIGILDKNGYQVLATDSSSTTYLGKGTFSNNMGNLSLYSNSYMEIHTKVDDIRISIESATHAPSKPYISIGADATGAYIKYSKNASRLYLGSGTMTYNGYTVYHSGNLTLSDYALATHTHEYIPTSDKVQPNSVTSTNWNTEQGRVPTLQFLSYWNGAYNSSGSSNLAYCNRGAFGTIVTKNINDFLSSSGNITLSGSLTIGSTLSNKLKAFEINAPIDQACVVISRTGSQSTTTGNFLDAAIDDIATDRILPISILKGTSTGYSNGAIVIGIDKDTTATYPGLQVRYVEKKLETKDSAGNVVGASYSTAGFADIYCKDLYASGSVHGTKAVFSSTGTFDGKVTASGFVTSSDIRLKENIESIDITKSIDILSRLTPVSYNYKNDKDNAVNRGLIAQQLKEIMMSEHCNNQIYSESENGTMAIDYIQLIPDIINVLKYLLYKVDKEKFFDRITESLEFDEAYYREHADEIAKK